MLLSEVKVRGVDVADLGKEVIYVSPKGKQTVYTLISLQYEPRGITATVTDPKTGSQMTFAAASVQKK